jgi:hypothetical protein
MKPGGVAIALIWAAAASVAAAQNFSPRVVWTCGPLSFNCRNGQPVRGLAFESEQAVRGAPLTLRFIAEEDSGFEITFESFAGQPTPAEPHGHKLGLETIQLRPGEVRELYYDTSPILIRSLEIHAIDDLTLGTGHALSHWQPVESDTGLEWRWGKTGTDSCALEYRDTKTSKITYFTADVTYVAPGSTFTPPGNERTAAREGGNGITARGTDRQIIDGGCAYVKGVRVRTVDRK